MEQLKISSENGPECLLCRRGVPRDSTGREHRVNPAHGETFVGPCSGQPAGRADVDFGTPGQVIGGLKRLNEHNRAVAANKSTPQQLRQAWRMSPQELENAFNALADENRREHKELLDRIEQLETDIIKVFRTLGERLADSQRRIEQEMEVIKIDNRALSMDLADGLDELSTQLARIERNTHNALTNAANLHVKLDGMKLKKKKKSR